MKTQIRKQLKLNTINKIIHSANNNNNNKNNKDDNNKKQQLNRNENQNT